MVESSDNAAVDLLSEAAQSDICKDAFKAYSEANFKVAKE